MLKEMTGYFVGEKQESLLFVAVGFAALGVAAWLWMNGHRLKSMAFPLVAIALIQIVVGGSVYLRTDTQLASLTRQYQEAPLEFKAQETARMQTVMKNFALYKTIEMGLLLVAVGLIAFMQRFEIAAGVGAGLALQSSFMLALDVFAEVRGANYLTALNGFCG